LKGHFAAGGEKDKGKGRKEQEKMKEMDRSDGRNTLRMQIYFR